jgi:hypothetical protein
MKRCQDAFDVYFYNDYNGYGIGEVVDNIVGAFLLLSLPAVWVEIEFG